MSKQSTLLDHLTYIVIVVIVGHLYVISSTLEEVKESLLLQQSLQEQLLLQKECSFSNASCTQLSTDSISAIHKE